MVRFLLIFIIFLSGCIKTVVPIPLTAQKNEISVGFQYLFIIFPFGRIAINDPETMLQNAISMQLTIARKTALPISFATSEISLNAYDYIFTRKISCSVKGALTAGNSTFPIEASYSGYSKFGFANELTASWQRCAKEVGQKIISALSLVSISRLP